MGQSVSSDAGAATDVRVLEPGMPLSQSLLWRLQRRYYDEVGAAAWVEGVVPSYVTSSPFTAKTYAQIVVGYLRDCLAADASARSGQAAAEAWSPIDADQPIYIIELGAGHGRFGFHFLRQLAQLRRGLPIAALRVKYVMTDFTESNITAWESSDTLKPLVDAGILDFAKFDMESDEQLTLRHSGEVLKPGSCVNPVITVANYVFDTVVQDLFRVRSGVLEAGRISLLTTAPTSVADDDPAHLAVLQTKFDYAPVDQGYYDDPEFDAILDSYRERLGTATLLFPLASVRCIRRIAAWSSQRILLLAGDKAYTHEHELAPTEGAHIAVHGSFSLMVNLHAVGRFFEQRGGIAVHAAPRPARIRASIFSIGAPGDLAETLAAYRDTVEGFSPSDYVSLVLQVRTSASSLGIEQALAALRLSSWDPAVFVDVFEVLLKAAGEAGEDLRRELHRVVERVWDAYMPQKHDLAFDIARIYYAMSRPLDAVRFYERSLVQFGRHHATMLNLAQCYFRLQQLDRARDCVNESLAIKADFDQARQWRIRIEAEIGDQT